MSRLSSEWVHVVPLRNSVRTIYTLFMRPLLEDLLLEQIIYTHSAQFSVFEQVVQVISISQLNMSPCFHPLPINVVVYHPLRSYSLF